VGGTSDDCSEPVELNVHVTVSPDCEQFDGNAAAEPANATAHNPNKPESATNNPSTRPRTTADNQVARRTTRKGIATTLDRPSVARNSTANITHQARHKQGQKRRDESAEKIENQHSRARWSDVAPSAAAFSRGCREKVEPLDPLTTAISADLV
jgi:hypothetical protein